MASIRSLKKDIDYLVYELISDCFAAMSVNQEEEVSDKLAEIVSDAVKLRNDLFSGIKYSSSGKDNVKTHDYYRDIRTRLIKEIDALFKKLSTLVSG